MKRIILLVLFCTISCKETSGQEIKKNTSEYNQDYTSLKEEILDKRIDFLKSYVSAGNAKKDSIIKLSRDYIFEKITSDIFNQWYGTQWNFYGQTKIPRHGKIACGYFVTTVLSDAGFNIPGDEWAKLASETFIVRLTKNVKRFQGKPVGDVITYLKTKGNGLYMVGLDCHTGFVYVKDGEARFVHSNYYEPEIGVMSQDLDSSNPLKASKYRILGRLLDDEMIKNWILNKEYK
ncbi:hypothetical protein [Flavobacterium sp. 3HN19-14]|uniref:hypothetical protein n=1 Tax=Flavobacterium sp. 3HN19-14 TaxID=3448133 RepID=UPI003EE0CB76